MQKGGGWVIVVSAERIEAAAHHLRLCEPQVAPVLVEGLLAHGSASLGCSSVDLVNRGRLS